LRLLESFPVSCWKKVDNCNLGFTTNLRR